MVTYLGVVTAAVLAEGDEEELEVVVPERQGGGVVDLVAAGEELELVVADLDDLGLVPDAQDLLTRLLLRRPQRQPQVRVVREQRPRLLRRLHRLHVRRSARLHDQADGPVVEHFGLNFNVNLV